MSLSRDRVFRKPAPAQLPLGRAFLTVVKVWLALLPRAVMVPMQTTMIRASITAYSTAVGPSSAFRNATALRAKASSMVWGLPRGLVDPPVRDGSTYG